MKKIVITIISTVVFCLGIIAQTGEDECQRINIEAPAVVSPNTKFNVTASFKNNVFPNYKYDWIIINDGEVTHIKQRKSIEVSSKNLKEIGEIIILADSFNKTCDNRARAEIIVVPPVGSPLIFDEYEELDWKEEKPRLDGVAIKMEEMTDQELLIYVNYDDKQEKKLKDYLFRILNYLSSRRLQKDRITFLLKTSTKKNIRLQPVPQNNNSEYQFRDYLIIKGEDLEKLAKLF